MGIIHVLVLFVYYKAFYTTSIIFAWIYYKLRLLISDLKTRFFSKSLNDCIQEFSSPEYIKIKNNLPVLLILVAS